MLPADLISGGQDYDTMLLSQPSERHFNLVVASRRARRLFMPPALLINEQRRLCNAVSCAFDAGARRQMADDAGYFRLISRQHDAAASPPSEALAPDAAYARVDDYASRRSLPPADFWLIYLSRARAILPATRLFDDSCCHFTSPTSPAA